MNDNERIVREFIAAWSDLDANALVEYFAPDGTYYNMPAQPVTGHDNLRKFITAFLANWEKTEWDILNLLAEGNVVMVERLDHTIAALDSEVHEAVGERHTTGTVGAVAFLIWSTVLAMIIVYRGWLMIQAWGVSTTPR